VYIKDILWIICVEQILKRVIVIVILRLKGDKKKNKSRPVKAKCRKEKGKCRKEKGKCRKEKGKCRKEKGK